MSRAAVCAVAFALATAATDALAGAPADDHTPANPEAPTLHLLRYTLRPQLQIDGGLSIIGPGFEVPIARQLALQVEVGAFGTYFLPWFDLGDRVTGAVGGVRMTWFADPSGKGLYVTPYVRSGYVVGTHNGVDGSGLALTSGAFAGWAFRPTTRLDVRLGLGAQYIYVNGSNNLSASTPFIAIDATVGLRL